MDCLASVILSFKIAIVAVSHFIGVELPQDKAIKVTESVENMIKLPGTLPHKGFALEFKSSPDYMTP